MESKIETLQKRITESIAVKQKLLSDLVMLERVQGAAERMSQAVMGGNRVFFAGNGGSAADAQHLAAEFVSRFEFDRPGLPSQSLSTDTSVITAISNDYGYEKLFRRQLQAQARKGDIFVGITTSGKSKNILAAFEVCRDLGVYSLALCGLGGELENCVDCVIRVPSTNTARIQECHILLGHLMCGYVEDHIFRDIKQ